MKLKFGLSAFFIIPSIKLFPTGVAPDNMQRTEAKSLFFKSGLAFINATIGVTTCSIVGYIKKY